MAKGNCAVCGKIVGVTNRYKLGDGNYICADCYRLAGFGITTNTGNLTLHDVLGNMSNNPTAIARQQKDAEKARAALEKFGLDFDSYTLDDLKSRNGKSAQEISSSLAGSKLYSLGSTLIGDPNQTFLMEMARAQVEQNFILMRQNEEIIRMMKIIYHELSRQ